MSAYYQHKSKAPELNRTEFDVLKASHKFLRSEDEVVAKSWDAQLAKKYEDTLFKEFAVCDLKHYKSGSIALRWRTEDEVLSGAGESTCSNTRCPYHDALSQSESGPSHSQGKVHDPPKPPKLTTMELPFSYIDPGETEVRQAMVKVVLCERCVKKVTWKRKKDKQHSEATEQNFPGPSSAKSEGGPSVVTETTDRPREKKLREHIRNERPSSRRNQSRSRSPRRRG